MQKTAKKLPAFLQWKTEELVLIGTFAALIKLLTLTVSLIGGGMNPLTLVLKNVIATSMLVVLIHKVPRSGVLILYVVQQAVVTMMLMGSGMIILPGYLIAAAIAEGMAFLAGGYRNTGAILLSVGFFDLTSRIVAMGMSWLFMRENLTIFFTSLIIVGISYLGCLIGLGTGVKFVKEFRHAGFIRN